jgi:hypothetical protein
MTKTLGHANVSTVLSIFAVTTFHRQKSRGFSDDVSSLSDSDAFFRCSMALTESETGGPHLESAQARLVQVFYLLMTCRMNQAWYIFGSLSQIMSALGMYRRDRRKIHNASSRPDYAHSLYPINPLSESRRVEVAKSLALKLDEWHASLPVLLRARPSSLVRSFRRQCVALRLAYKHAIVHLHRPFLHARSSGEASLGTESAERFREESIKLCIGAARDALRTIDTLAQEGPLFHAFWWTHYITFCALTVTYVWDMQRGGNIEGIDR